MGHTGDGGWLSFDPEKPRPWKSGRSCDGLVEVLNHQHHGVNHSNSCLEFGFVLLCSGLRCGDNGILSPKHKDGQKNHRKLSQAKS